MKKKTTFVIAIAAVMIAILSLGSLAYFTAEETAHNVISTGTVEISVDEWADAEKTTPFPEDGLENVLPGDDVTKIVEVTNEGSGEAWVRIAAVPTVTPADGVDAILDMEYIDVDFNENWEYNEEDGLFYYNKALAPGETAEPLFTTVSFDIEMPNEYQGCTVEIDITAQAVQTANNGETALEAQGWPELVLPQEADNEDHPS